MSFEDAILNIFCVCVNNNQRKKGQKFERETRLGEGGVIWKKCGKDLREEREGKM